LEIFVSRPTWVEPEYEEGLSTFLIQLKNLELTPRTLGVSDYPSKAPLDEVIGMLSSCKGAIILGYPQLEINSGILKGVKLAKPLHLATEWNHLEGAIAYSMGIPLLIIHHTTISRGIFDRGVLNAFMHSVDLTNPNWSMQEALNGAINNWKESCVKGGSNFTVTNKQVHSDKPQFPNCSTNQKAIYMSSIPAPFAKIEGNEWECSRCHYME